jgi:hypothetical protein
MNRHPFNKYTYDFSIHNGVVGLQLSVIADLFGTLELNRFMTTEHLSIVNHMK